LRGLKGGRQAGGRKERSPSKGLYDFKRAFRGGLGGTIWLERERLKKKAAGKLRRKLMKTPQGGPHLRSGKNSPR